VHRVIRCNKRNFMIALCDVGNLVQIQPDLFKVKGSLRLVSLLLRLVQLL